MGDSEVSCERKNFKKLFSYLGYLVFWQALFLKADTCEEFWVIHIVLKYENLFVCDMNFLDKIDLGTLLELQ